MEPKKPAFSSLDSASFVDAVTLAEILDDSMEAGYQFYLTDEELVLFCLKRKICGLGKDLEMIPVIDIYKCNPEDLLAPTILQNDDGKNRDWFFFSAVAKNHPNKEWFHRTSEQGYWEATGEDHVLTWDSLAIGVKKAFVYYERKTGQTSWFMHQYTLHEDELKRCEKVQDLYILCKVFKKKGARALVVKEGSENGDTTMDIDVKTSGDIGDLMDVDDFHRKLNSILFGPIRAPAPHPIPDLHVDAFFMIPQINPGHPQNAEGEVSPVPVPELEPLPMPMSMLVPLPTPEPPRNALPLPDGNGNGGQPPAAPQQENHPPTDIHNEEIQAHQLDMSEISEVDDDFVDPLPEFPNEEDPLQNVELVEDSGVLLIDPYAIPGMVYIGHGHSDDDADADDDDDDEDDDEDDDDDDDDVAIVDEVDDEVEFEEGEIVLYLEPDVISSISYEIPLSDTESETSVLQPNREFEVQTYGSGGENNIPNPAEENTDVVEEQNNDSAPTDEGDSEATSSSSHHVD